MFGSRKPKAAPGSAEFVSRQLTMSGHSCSHYPKLKPGIQTGIPTRLGFFSAGFNPKAAANAEGNRLSVLLTERLCRACYDAAVPQGFDVWCISQHGPCPAVKVVNAGGYDFRFPVLVEAGTETFSDYGRVLHVIFNRPAFPAHADALAAWTWMQKRRRPVYIDALHATSQRDPTLGQRVNTDALVATRHGTIFNAASAHKAAQDSVAQMEKSSKRWSLGQKFSPSNFRASLSNVSLASPLRRNRSDQGSESIATRDSIDTRTVRFDEQMTSGRTYQLPLHGNPRMVPHLHKRPLNQRVQSQPHPSVFLPPTYRPRTYLPRSHSDVSWGGYPSLDERLAAMRGPSTTPSLRGSNQSSTQQLNTTSRPTLEKQERTKSNLSSDVSEASSNSSTDDSQRLELPLKSPRRASLRPTEVPSVKTPPVLSPSEHSESSYTDSGHSTPIIEPRIVTYPVVSEKTPVIVVSGAKADMALSIDEIPAHLAPVSQPDVTKDLACIYTRSIPGAYID